MTILEYLILNIIHIFRFLLSLHTQNTDNVGTLLAFDIESTVIVSKIAVNDFTKQEQFKPCKITIKTTQCLRKSETEIEVILLREVTTEDYTYLILTAELLAHAVLRGWLGK